ncbi:DUF4178 domain-containing protein [Ohtaekwangia kribbensis]|uniref:DUF4178 domain-containing protein n=1 Tax=Ohtaekwangia kribbensis TaxID=688913 RepID=A0ABW3JWI2_9BACT
MSGSNYTITCLNCGTVNTVRGKAMTLAMTCSSCQYYVRLGKWNTDRNIFGYKDEPAIPIGAKGKFDGVVYEVMGFVVKQESKYHYKWREYLLFNPMHGYAFLSEYSGNWNFVWPVEVGPKDNPDMEFYYEESFYRLYQKYSADVIYARGEFFFDVVDLTASTTNHEYIAPPYMTTLEKNGDSLLWCKGEYCSPQEVAQAFNIPVSRLPKKEGRGYTQPVVTSFKEGTLIKASLAILLVIIALQFYFNSSAKEEVVFSGTFNQSELKDQKFFVSSSFDLKGGTKSVAMDIYAPLVNDWFYADFALINETTGTEYNFSKDIEYYSGYEDGESWSEGSTRGEAFLSEIPEGRYHINIYPEFSVSYQSFSIRVVRDVSSLSNFIVILVLLAIFPAVFFIRKYMLEAKRWEDSDYSPYATEE